MDSSNMKWMLPLAAVAATVATGGAAAPATVPLLEGTAATLPEIGATGAFSLGGAESGALADFLGGSVGPAGAPGVLGGGPAPSLYGGDMASSLPSAGFRLPAAPASTSWIPSLGSVFPKDWSPAQKMGSSLVIGSMLGNMMGFGQEPRVVVPRMDVPAHRGTWGGPTSDASIKQLAQEMAQRRSRGMFG